MRFCFLCSLYCLLCSVPLSPSHAQDTTVIAAFGDSLFAGFGISAQDAFPEQLERRLLADGYHVKVLNDGISADTTADGLARIDSVIAQKPDIVILELGANDMLRALPPKQTENNLDEILSQLQGAGVKKILVAGQKAPLSYGLAYSSAYNPLFCTLAKKYNASCYPVYLEGVYGHAEWMQTDGMHPNADGVKMILDKIYPSVKALLKKS